MPASARNISQGGKVQFASWTVLGTLGCVGVSVAYNWLAFRGMDPEAFRQGLVSATVLPTILAGPLLFYLTLRLRDLAVANHKLGVMASTDGLTNCLNRGAFSKLVDSRLSDADAGDPGASGALLIIDADHFKTINDAFGHQQGDEALKLIARAIKSALRAGDLVGRLGGEEFGVFLPDAEAESAAFVAERIRSVVEDLRFAPDGKTRGLSVSVGCATFDRRIGFAELFKLADARLYEAKNSGRNKVMSDSVAGRAAAPSPVLAVH